jgi:hypothetical protein
MAADFAWRKKELARLKAMVTANEKTPNLNLHIRVAVTLLYAHWEGFIKQISSVYLEFVSEMNLKNNELPAHFLAISVRRLVDAAMANSKVQTCLDIVDFFRSQGDARSKITSAVNTQANLKSSVFRDIVLILGLDYSRFATKEKLIDEKLLKNRNSIAHGQFLLVGFDEYIELHDEMLGMMQDFYNQVDNQAFTGAYRKI